MGKDPLTWTQFIEFVSIQPSNRKIDQKNWLTCAVGDFFRSERLIQTPGRLATFLNTRSPEEAAYSVLPLTFAITYGDLQSRLI